MTDNVVPFPPRENPPPDDGHPAYAELQCVTNFSFLRGGSHPAELVEQAKALGLSALGVADRNSVAGVVRAHTAAKKAGLKLLVGARIDTVPHGFEPRQKNGRNEKLEDSPLCDAPPGFSCLVYPTDRAAWGRLCRLLSKGKMRAQKGECHLWMDDLVAALEGQMVIAIPPDGWTKASHEDAHKLNQDAEIMIQLEEGGAGRKASQNKGFKEPLKQLIHAAPGRVWLAAHMLYNGDDRRRLHVLNQLAQEVGIPLVATNDVHIHHPDRRPLQDVISCIREKCTLETAGFKLAQNAERHLKPAAEMHRLFADFPHAIEAGLQIASRCHFSLDELSYHYPNEPVPSGKTAQQHLEDLT